MNFRKYPSKKTYHFVITISIIIILIQVMIFISTKTLNLYLLFIFLTINLLNLFLKNIIKFFAYYWEIFGIYLGKFMSPILLCFIYIISILSVNLLFRLLRVDTLNKEIVPKKTTYWAKSESKINFKNQF